MQKPSAAPQTHPRDIQPFPALWFYLTYLLLAVAVVTCLVDDDVDLPSKGIAVLLSAAWTAWYATFGIHRAGSRHGVTLTGLTFIAAIAASIALSWIHPAFLMLCFSFYGLSFGVLPVRWAVPLVLLLSAGLVWRFAAFSGGFGRESLPMVFGFLMSAFFSVLLGIFIDRIVRQSHQRQQMIEELASTRDELARAERQAGMLEERQRLAGEIHDTLAQGFSGIVMHLEAAEASLESEPQAALRHIRQARQTGREHLAEARRFLWALRPDLLGQEPLGQALERVCQRWSGEAAIPVTVEVNGPVRALPPALEATFLRTTQEALANIRKHARASQVNLTLTFMEDETILDIQDDGVGFDAAQMTDHMGPDQGYGLAALRERAAQLGGRFTIESTPGEGTTLALCLPVPGQEN